MDDPEMPSNEEMAQTFSDYLTETCGNPLDNLEMPEMPESTE